MGLIWLLVVCLLLPCYAQAVSTADAAEPIDVTRQCTLTLFYGYDGKGIADLSVKLYKIADASAECEYTLTETFRSTQLNLNGVQSQSEWNSIRTTLEAYIVANGILENVSTRTDGVGQVRFDNLDPGLYLTVPGAVNSESVRYAFVTGLTALPGLDTEGYWQYDVVITAKGEILPPVEPEQTIQYKVLKLWKGDEGRSDRPKKVEVEIFRDGLSQQTVTLSEDNQWAYSWTAADDGAKWTVIERNVPSGYKATLEERSGTFVLTNTRTSTSSTSTPKTGDTSNILLHMIVMYLSGTMLILLGLTGKRKRV